MPGKWRPAREWLNMRDEVDHLFNEFLSRRTSRSSAETWSPNTDILESENNINVTIEMPGVKKEDIKLSIQENVLNVRGVKKPEEKVKGEIYYRVERNFGVFNRSFDLPCPVDVKKIIANFTDGVLKIILPKTDESKTKDIPISVD